MKFLPVPGKISWKTEIVLLRSTLLHMKARARLKYIVNDSSKLSSYLQLLYYVFNMPNISLSHFCKLLAMFLRVILNYVILNSKKPIKFFTFKN